MTGSSLPSASPHPLHSKSSPLTSLPFESPHPLISVPSGVLTPLTPSPFGRGGALYDLSGAHADAATTCSLARCSGSAVGNLLREFGLHGSTPACSARPEIYASARAATRGDVPRAIRVVAAAESRCPRPQVSAPTRTAWVRR